MIEGIMAPLLAELSQKGTWLKHSHIPEELSEWLGCLAGSVGFAAYMCLLAFLADHLYGYEDWKHKSPAQRAARVGLNRHWLVHGVTAVSGRMDTLRCFLALDVIEAMLPGLRRELAQMADGAGPEELLP